MAHLNELIDFTVAAYIVNNDKVLLIHHKKLNLWLPIGGHIELDEDPEQALFREIQEESGFKAEDLEILSSKSKIKSDTTKFLFKPNFLDIHKISDSHRHVGMIYFAKSNKGEVILAEKEHNQIRWFSKEDLRSDEFGVRPEIVFYANEALSLAI